MECLFQHLSDQYEFGFWNENVLREKWGYFKKSWVTNCAKMRIFKMGVTLFKSASCMYCWTFCQYLHCQGYMTRLSISGCKKSSHLKRRKLTKWRWPVRLFGYYIYRRSEKKLRKWNTLRYLYVSFEQNSGERFRAIWPSCLIGTCPMRKAFLSTTRGPNLLYFPRKNIIFFEIIIWPFYGQSFVKTVRSPSHVLSQSFRG